jgi:type IV pilus assembly protein PilM
LLFTNPKKAIGLDIGSHSVKAIQMSRTGHDLRIDEAGFALLDRNQVNADPVSAHANAILEATRNMSAGASLVVAALPGQTAVIRYPRFPDMAPEELEAAIQKEAAQNIPFDLDEVFLDWSPLEELEEGEQKQLKVLLVAAKHEVIDSRLQLLEAAELECGIMGVDSLALADAAECCGFLRGDETVALVNIGLTSTSVHFVKDGVSNFIREVSWGARELIQAIAKERRCEYEAAEKMLQQLSGAGDFPEPPAPPSSPAGEGEAPERMMPESVESGAVEAPGEGGFDDIFGEEAGGIEDLTPPAPQESDGPGLEDLMASGAPEEGAITGNEFAFDDDPFGGQPETASSPPSGGNASLLDPLDDEEHVDAFRDPGESPDAASGGGGAGNEREELRAILAHPLSRMVAEIRRCFDFHDHQLFEQPVSRVILSGGIARIPYAGEILLDELGVDSVETADPSASALRPGNDMAMADLVEHPARFMVAIGLAARGMADL